MEREEQLKLCNVCKNRKFNPKVGTICGLTDELPTFSGTCNDYIEESNAVRLQKLAQDKIVAETNKTLNKGRYALFVIGGISFLVGFWEAFLIPGHQLLFGIIDWTFGLMFIGLGVWSYYKPFVALLSGLCLYVSLILILAIIDPYTIFRGVIWKIAVISFLVYAIKIARDEEKINKSKASEILDQL